MVYVLFFLSGAAALVYEIAWSRQLGLLFGHTVHAAAVVLGAYFAGMALGNWLAGRFAGRSARPLVGYGLAELCVAAWALATPWVLSRYALPPLSGLLNHPDPALQLGIRATVAFCTLLPATIALGATLPFIAQHVSPPDAPRPRLIALAYAANTAGAFTGVALATFTLILWLGVAGSGMLAVVVSAACGIAALLIASRHPVTPSGTTAAGAGRTRDATSPLATSSPPPDTAATPVAPLGTLSPTAWYALAALSGFLTLGAQVLYTRMAALTFQNSTYTFGTVVAVFLIALSLGSWLASLLHRRLTPAAIASAACVLAAVLIPLGIVAFQRATDLQSLATGLPYYGYLLAACGLIALAALAPVIAMGAVLPAAFTAVPRGAVRAAGHHVGRLAALNTVAAATGALATSFLLLPTIGLHACFALFTAAYLVAAGWLAVKRFGFTRVVLPALGVLVLVTAATVATFRPLTGDGDPGEELLWQRETPYGLLCVKETGGLYRSLYQNNSYRLGSTYRSELERRQAHLPLLLHEDPRRVCFLGLATGITAGAALAHPAVEQVTAVELVPAVVEAAGFFAEANGGVLTDARALVVINDARHYLQATPERFDVVVSDLFVPWHSQTGYLYTVEHYRRVRSRLAPGGVFCQWLALYEVAPRELETIADSLAAVFPHVTLWRDAVSSTSPLIALVGSEEPLTLDAAGLNVRWGRASSDYSQYDPELDRGSDILALYVGAWPADPGAVLNTDDRPRIEFLAPISDGSHLKLTGDRLRAYYDDVLLKLPLTGVVYVPLRAEPAPDLTAGRRAQRAGVHDAATGGVRRLY